MFFYTWVKFALPKYLMNLKFMQMKVINSFIKVSFVLLLLTFCSCQDRVYNKNETEQRIRTMLLTPDSLRSPEDKALFRKLEAIYY